jgi:hypothetical protein
VEPQGFPLSTLLRAFKGPHSFKNFIQGSALSRPHFVILSFAGVREDGEVSFKDVNIKYKEYW